MFTDFFDYNRDLLHEYLSKGQKSALFGRDEIFTSNNPTRLKKNVD